ncbi:unnamed protein product, partial [Staurois parvus]
EQNIYNVVFHELIRQVSVECMERGELLAKLRQRYVLLLDKIPRQVLSLYNDLLAQRALGPKSHRRDRLFQELYWRTDQ